jgi:hypothetical protein
MVGNIKRGGFLMKLAAIALVSIPGLGAQTPQDPAPAPIPAQIVAAKRVFISNASGESGVPAGVPDLTYNEFYAAIKSWGRYEIVAAPADADLVFEIRFVMQPQLTVTILDPKTHTVLWAFTEGVQQAAQQKTGRKYFDEAMANIVNDVKKLTALPTASAS